jgi:phosphate transport system permease protein
MDAAPPPTQSAFATTGRSRMGEPWVWLTAAGLTIGVCMAVGLFLLILIKGSASFWPNRIDLMEVEVNGQIEKIAGYVTQESQRRDAEGVLHEEIQVFRGNRDLSGEAFKYIDRDKIVSTSRPESLLLVERLVYGPAIVTAVALETPAGRIPAESSEFEKSLNRTIAESADARARLLRIERKQIGAISREMEALARAGRSGTVDPQTAENRNLQLQKEFETLQKQVASIREELAGSRLIGSTADGRELIIQAGTLLGVFPSNRAGFFERVGETIHRVWRFLKDDPREANTEGGVFPAIFGTVVMTLVMSLFVTPFGVMASRVIGV